MSNKNRKLEIVIYYLVEKLGTRLTKTKLMKLLFISDYIAKKGKKFNIGRTITGTKYIYYTYGPFSKEVYKAISDMDGHEINEIDMSELTDHETLYSYETGDNPRFEIELDPEEKTIIDAVIEKYGYMPLDNLLTLVYNSKPMKSAKVRDVILE